MSEYTIRELCMIFRDYALRFEADKAEYDPKCGISKEDYDFNISRALQVICEEISYLSDPNLRKIYYRNPDGTWPKLESSNPESEKL